MGLEHRNVGLVAGATLAALASAAAFVAWALVSPATLHEQSLEDHSIEWASAIGFGVAALGFAASLFRSTFPRHLSALARAWVAGWALLMFVFMGEELSWGQRIFGFPTPPAMRELNEQHEFNLHNLHWIQHWKYEIVVALVAITGVLLPLLNLLRHGRALLRRIAMPVVPVAWIASFVVTLFFLRNFANWFHLVSRNDAQEIGEMYLALAMSGFALHAAVRPRDLFPHSPPPTTSTATVRARRTERATPSLSP